MTTEPQTDPRLRAIAHLSDSFRQFSRNGRWGTCGFCPRDSQGRAYPEFCRDTNRPDHQLDAGSLAENFNRTYNVGNCPICGAPRQMIDGVSQVTCGQSPCEAAAATRGLQALARRAIARKP